MSNCSSDYESDSDHVPLRAKRCISDAESDVDDDVPIAKRFKKSKYTSFEIKREIISVEISIGECERERSIEEQKLQSLERDIEECSEQLQNKKKQASSVRRIYQYYEKMQRKIKNHVKDLEEKEAQVCLIEKHVNELKKNNVELCKITDNNGQKEEEPEILSQKIAECTKEIKTKEDEFDDLEIFVSRTVEELRTDKKKLLNVMNKRYKRDKRRANRNELMTDFEAQFEVPDTELHSKEKDFEGRAKELESKDMQLEVRVKEFESKQVEFEGRVKEC